MKYLKLFEEQSRKNWNDLSDDDKEIFTELIVSHFYEYIIEYLDTNLYNPYSECLIDGDELIVNGYTDGSDYITDDEYEELRYNDQETDFDYEERIADFDMKDVFEDFMYYHIQKEIILKYLETKKSKYLDFVKLVGMDDKIKEEYGYLFYFLLSIS